MPINSNGMESSGTSPCTYFMFERADMSRLGNWIPAWDHWSCYSRFCRFQLNLNLSTYYNLIPCMITHFSPKYSDHLEFSFFLVESLYPKIWVLHWKLSCLILLLTLVYTHHQTSDALIPDWRLQDSGQKQNVHLSLRILCTYGTLFDR